MKSEAKKDSTRHLKLVGQRALAEGRSAEEIVAEARRSAPTQAGIPINWTDGNNQRNTATSMLLPSEREVRSYGGIQPMHMCGQCKFFDLESGRKEIQRQRLYERLEREDQWKLRHLGVDPETLGLCGADTGRLTGALTNADKCDQFRRKS